MTKKEINVYLETRLSELSYKLDGQHLNNPKNLKQRSRVYGAWSELRKLYEKLEN